VTKIVTVNVEEINGLFISNYIIFVSSNYSDNPTTRITINCWDKMINIFCKW